MNNSFWKNRRVFITGVNGFLGSWLAIELLNRQAAVVGLFRDQIPDSNLIFSGADKKVIKVNGTITDFEAVSNALHQHSIQYCFHVAAQPIVGLANENPLPTFESNIQGTWTVLEAARRTPTMQGVVVASSDKAYGTQATPYREEAPLLGENPYDVSKVCTDQLTRCYAKSLGLPAAVTRCSNLFGGGDINFSRVIPGTVKSLISNSRPIIRSDGSPVRDYLYITDAVEAYLRLAERLSDPVIRGEAFNFGLGEQISVLEVVKRLIEILGKKHLQPVIQGVGKMRGEIDKQYLSVDKAKRILDWRPLIGLEAGLRETYQWYQRFFETHQSYLASSAEGPQPKEETQNEKEQKILEERLRSLGYL